MYPNTLNNDMSFKKHQEIDPYRTFRDIVVAGCLMKSKLSETQVASNINWVCGVFFPRLSDLAKSEGK